jgi:hypothetical protein
MATLPDKAATVTVFPVSSTLAPPKLPLEAAATPLLDGNVGEKSGNAVG